MEWSVDIERRTASSESGIVVKFVRAAEGAWNGRIVAGIERVPPESAARLMREAGDAFAEALKEKNRAK
jgi:hypothetical protein